jgi:hypothetical protein
LKVSKDIVNELAVIVYVNEDGIIQTEMRSYPQDYKVMDMRGLPVADADYMLEQAQIFKQDNPQFKSVFVRKTVTTDYHF